MHDPYGGPDGLKRFVDACHARGLGVVMDVVYNHLGPAGNYLPEFGPYLTEAHTTPWGPAVNLDQPGSDEVRRYVLDNALMWLRDYHVDGLRLDAVHAFVDERATHLLEELSVEVEALGAQLRKPLWLVAESDLNDPRMVTSREAGGVRHRRAVGRRRAPRPAREPHGRDRAATTATSPACRSWPSPVASVFLHDGRWSSFREPPHGRPVPPTVPGHRFVVYLQDHDQVGNRATGDRISATLSDGLLKVGAALVLTSPYTPMLWMGEEWGARTPWQFFSDHEGDLGEAVRKGRRAEFAPARLEHRGRARPAGASRPSATARWTGPSSSSRGTPQLLAWTRDLIALRRDRPELSRRPPRPGAGDLRRGRPLAASSAAARRGRVQPRRRGGSGAVPGARHRSCSPAPRVERSTAGSCRLAGESVVGGRRLAS